MDAIAAFAARRDTPKVVDADKTGFAGLTSQDFLKILVEQLQNQDPTDPMDSDQLLNQISQMRTLQSGLELDKTLKALTLSQGLSSATSFIGKSVTASIDNSSETITGVVDRVLVRDGETFLKSGTREFKLANVTEVREAS
jgi:flagellar basal-body rod modification protein FlgD